MTQIIIVTAAFEAAQAKWTATSPDLAGLFLAADTWIDLTDQLPATVRDRLSRSTAGHRGEFSIEVLLHTTLRVTIEPPVRRHFGVSKGPRCIGRDGLPASAKWEELSIHSAA